MANDQQLRWIQGEEAKPLPLKVKNEDEFIQLCILRGQLHAQGCEVPKTWHKLAENFRKAIGRDPNALSEWCMRQIQQGATK